MGMRFIQHPETGEIIPANEYVRPPTQRSDLPSPMVVNDQMDELRHPNTGKHYGSKSEFRRATRLSGGIELGSDTLNVSPHVDQVSQSDVGEAIQKVKAGYKPVLGTGSEGWSDAS